MPVVLTLAIVLGATVAVAPGGSAARPSPPSKLSSERVQEAIRFGRSASDKDLEQYVLKTSPTWTVNFDTPFLRVAQLSRAWKRRDREMKEADVPARVIEPDIHVYALALQQPGVTEKLRSLRHVTIRTAGAHDSIQPRSMKTNINRARNRGDFSPAKIARSVQAVFSMRDFAAGNDLRIEFEDGTTERIKITRELLASIR